MYISENEVMQQVLDNCDFVAEALNYIWHGMTDRAEVEADVRECLEDYDATEDDVQEYTDKVMCAIEEYK